MPVELTVRTCFRCPATSTIKMIDFQKRKYVTSTVGTMPPSQTIYCFLPQTLVLLTPLAPLFFQAIVIILFTALTISNHVAPHIFAMFLLAFFCSSVTIVLLCHIGSITHNVMA